jgi:hypothetical protein
MATLIDADVLGERFDLDDSDSYPDARIEPNILSASRSLRRWVDTNYDASLALIETPDEDDVDGTAMVADLQNAEAHLAIHFAILGFNSPLTSKGVVTTAMAAEGKEVRRYLSPKETAELATMYLETVEVDASEHVVAVSGSAAV